MADEAERNLKLEAAKELLKRKKVQKAGQDDLLSFIQHTHPAWEDAPHHRLLCDWLMKLEKQKIERLCIFAPPRHGKAVESLAFLPTPQGFRRHGDLAPGDEVFAPDGTPTKVIACTVDVPCDVRITFSDGEQVIVHENHEWVFHSKSTKRWKQLETKRLFGDIYCGKNPNGTPRAKWMSAYNQPLQFPEKKLDLHPYVLGVWLGDGTSRGATITQCIKDSPHIISRFKHLGYTCTKQTLNPEEGAYKIYFGCGKLHRRLKRRNLLNNKHIPADYLYASEEQRRELLRGLVDTDGCVDPKTGRVRFINCDKTLIDGVCWLVASLGYRSSTSSADPKLSTSGIQGKQVVYTVGWSPHDNHRKAWVPRKNVKKTGLRRLRSVTSVERCEPVPGKCIQVAHPSGEYLIGKRLVPTHNSEIVSRRFPAWCMGRHPDWEMICVQTNGELARDMGANVRDIIGSSSFQDIFPNVKLRADAKAAGRWLVKDTNHPTMKNGIYQSAGITGSVIGKGANLLNIDDPLDAAGAASPRIRNVAADFYFKDCRPRLMTPGLELLTTTRRHEDGLEGRILPPEEKWELIPGEKFVYKAVVSEHDYADPIIWYIIKLPAIIDEGASEERALWPGVGTVRFPLPRLKSIRADLLRQRNAQEWYAQYQQEVSPEEGNFCKRDWFEERYDLVPEDLWVFATSDVAVTEEKPGTDPDYTEHCIFGLEGLQIEYDHEGKLIANADYCYVLDWWYGKTTADEWIQEFIRLYKLWRPQTWFGTRGVIKNSVEKYIERELRQNHVYCRLEWLSDGKDKAAKGRAMQGMASSRRILFPKKAWAERVIQNVCTFPNAMHDDAYDTLCNAIRAMGDIPDAFIGAPVKQNRQFTDSYEEVKVDSYKNWKVL